MSFGCSISDVALLTSTSYKLVQNTRHACGEHEEVTKQLGSLHVVLQRLENDITYPASLLNQPGNSSREDVEQIMSGCQKQLSLLETIVEKYSLLSQQERSARKFWKKVKFGNGEIVEVKDIQSKIAFYTSALTLYLNLVSTASMGRVEKKMEEAGEDLKDVKRAINAFTAKVVMNAHSEGSVLTNYSQDDKTVWKEFRRHLVNEGFRSSFLHKNKKLIQAYFVELGARGVLDEAEEGTGMFEMAGRSHDNAFTPDTRSTSTDAPPTEEGVLDAPSSIPNTSGVRGIKHRDAEILPSSANALNLVNDTSSWSDSKSFLSRTSEATFDHGLATRRKRNSSRDDEDGDKQKSMSKIAEGGGASDVVEEQRPISELPDRHGNHGRNYDKGNQNAKTSDNTAKPVPESARHQESTGAHTCFFPACIFTGEQFLDLRSHVERDHESTIVPASLHEMLARGYESSDILQTKLKKGCDIYIRQAFGDDLAQQLSLMDPQESLNDYRRTLARQLYEQRTRDLKLRWTMAMIKNSQEFGGIFFLKTFRSVIFPDSQDVEAPGTNPEVTSNVKYPLHEAQPNGSSSTSVSQKDLEKEKASEEWKARMAIHQKISERPKPSRRVKHSSGGGHRYSDTESDSGFDDSRRSRPRAGERFSSSRKYRQRSLSPPSSTDTDSDDSRSSRPKAGERSSRRKETRQTNLSPPSFFSASMIPLALGIAAAAHAKQKSRRS